MENKKGLPPQPAACHPIQSLTRRQFLRLTGIAAGAALLGQGCKSKPVPTPTPTLAPTATLAPTLTPTPEAKIVLTDLIIGVCGYDCASCPKYQDKSCQGCLADTCNQNCLGCPVRTCGREHAAVNCAHCREYACEKLESMYQRWISSGWSKAARESKAVLEAVRQSEP